MGKTPPRPGLENAAWVTIPNKLSVQELKSFCESVENLFRLNPYLKIKSWQTKDSHNAHVRWENHSSHHVFLVDTDISVDSNHQEIKIEYKNGPKKQTLLIVNAVSRGSELIIIDDYGENTHTSYAEIDKSLNAWGESLKQFFNHYAVIKYVPFVRLLINKVWIRMNPMARRITYILFVITTVELIALLLFVIAMLLKS